MGSGALRGDGAADTGASDPRLTAALAGTNRAELLASLVDARVFVAITATTTALETTADGLRAESSAEMAVVLLEAPDGSRALPVFSDLGALTRWRVGARPVPMSGAQACAAALDEGATAVLLDGRVSVTELADLARGWVPVPGSGLAARRGEALLEELAVPAPRGLAKALRRVLAGEGLVSARLLAGPDGLVLGIAPRRALEPAALAALAQRIVQQLGADLPAAGLDLAQVRARGPGQEVLGRFRWGR